MFTVASEDKVHALKPMSCPCHVHIFNKAQCTLRMAEFGSCYMGGFMDC